MSAIVSVTSGSSRLALLAQRFTADSCLTRVRQRMPGASPRRRVPQAQELTGSVPQAQELTGLPCTLFTTA